MLGRTAADNLTARNITDTVKIPRKYKQNLGSLQTGIDRPIVTNVKRTGELALVTVALDFIKQI